MSNTWTEGDEQNAQTKKIWTDLHTQTHTGVHKYKVSTLTLSWVTPQDDDSWQERGEGPKQQHYQLGLYVQNFKAYCSDIKKLDFTY